MSDRRWRKWELTGLFVTLIFGNLLHFVYNWSGKKRIVAAFAAINECTWEHMTRLVVPGAVWWTYDPPQLPLFTDPVTGQTGLFAGNE